MKYKINICIYAYLHNLMQISDIFYHHNNMDMMNYIIWKYFYRKTWRNPVISHDFRWKSQFFPKIRQKFAYSKFKLIKKKKVTVQIFFSLHFFILLDLFYDCANFRVNRSISCRDLRGGGQISPPPMDSSPRNNPMGIGLKVKIMRFIWIS